MYGMAAHGAAFASGFGGSFNGGVTRPMGMSPTASFAEHQQVLW
jgi:hypothetical protein